MSDLTSENFNDVIVACRENAPLLAESFNQCFDTTVEAVSQAPLSWDAASSLTAWRGPGLWITIGMEAGGLGVVIPVGSVLPAWIKTPNASEKSRLETLAQEWSLNLLPETLLAEKSRCEYSENLQLSVTLAQPDPDAQILPIQLNDAAAGTSSEIWVVGPLVQLGLAAIAEAALEAPPPAPQPAPLPAAVVDRLALLKRLAVPVIVKLAEKKIPLNQLRSISPGAIVQFEKSCEDLLELCVNNAVYCRGEAVKIGEKFGLKVNALGPFADLLDPLGGKGDRII